LSFASIYINPDNMKHLIKRGLGSLKCCTWAVLAFGLILFVWAGLPKLFYETVKL